MSAQGPRRRSAPHPPDPVDRGGELRVVSALGAGTTVTGTVPV